MIQGSPGGLFQFSDGEPLKLSWHLHHHPYVQCGQIRKNAVTGQRQTRNPKEAEPLLQCQNVILLFSFRWRSSHNTPSSTAAACIHHSLPYGFDNHIFTPCDIYRGTLCMTSRLHCASSPVASLTRLCYVSDHRLQNLEYCNTQQQSASLTLTASTDKIMHKHYHLRFEGCFPGEPWVCWFLSVFFLRLFQNRTFRDKWHGFSVGRMSFLTWGPTVSKH